MYFKEQYKNEIDKAAPSREFLEGLADKMEQECALNRRRKIRIASTLVSAAACVAVVIGAAALFNRDSGVYVPSETVQSQTDTSKPDVKAETASCAAAETFAIKSWHEDNISDTEVFKTLVERMRGDLKKLYFSDTDSFGRDDILSADETAELIEKIENANECDSHGKAVTNYMAVFEDGSVAKFTVCDDDTIYIKEIDASFKY